MSLDRGQLSVQFLIARVRHSVRQAQLQLFPGNHPGPQKWLSLIAGLLDTAQQRLEASSDEAGAAADRRLQLEDAAHAVTEAYQRLREMDGADVTALPYPLIAPLQRWFSSLQLLNTTFFRAYLDTNYELRSFHSKQFARIREPAPSLTAALANIQWPMLRVTVPAKAFTLIPHLAIVAHEIGHALVDRIAFATDPLGAEWPSLMQRLRDRLGGAPLDLQAMDAFKRVFTSWYEEFTADAFMLILTGPAGFFSLSDVLQLLDRGSGGYSRTHPSSFQRREVLHRRLEEAVDGLSFREVFHKRTGVDLVVDANSPLITKPANADEIFVQRRSRSVEEAAVMAELYSVMPILADAAHAKALEVVRSVAPDLIYTPAKLDHDLATHLEPLLEAIPPIETGDSLEGKQPLELSTILNVGWAVMLAKLDQLKVKAVDRGEQLDKLHALLLKAIELSEARRAWMTP